MTRAFLRSAVCVAALAIGGLTGSASAQTFYETLVMAYNSNPDLQAQRAALRSTDEAYVQASSARLPSVSAAGSVSDSGFSNLTTQNYSITATQSIYRGGRTQGAIDQATAQIMAGRETLRSVEQSVLLNAATAFLDVARDEDIVEIRRNNVEVLSQQLQAARDRFEVGEITRTDVAQSEARLSGAQAQLAAAQAQVSVSRANYERIVGSPAMNLSDRPDLPTVPSDLASAAELGLSNNPSLLAAQYAETSARQGVRVARGNFLPEVSVSGSLGHGRDVVISGDDRDSASITGRVSIPLYTGGLNGSRVRAAVAQEEQARNQVDAARRQVISGVASAYSSYQASLAVIESSRQSVRANQIALDGVEQEALVGIRTTLDVLNAEQELLDARLTLVSAERDAYVAAYNLLVTVGTFTAQDLALNVEMYDPEAQRHQTGFPNVDLTPWN
ncbi:TolC family outer membrane protein [Maricaulis sp. D1M11]|uniref:TolC family outer membrane protein n=1 Tax=Maricaulis sp. D1M11 TaxID=3076117 RepID=UPI0039B4FA04